jgi:UDP-glucose 4-epimerase
MKLLITGIAGFLGSHLADKFIAQGHEVIGVDNLIGGYMTSVPYGVKFYEYDCGNLEAMNRIMEDVDVVYHCACTAYEGLSVFSPSLIVDNTVGITASILSAAISNNVKRFVYCSSMARYGHGEPPFKETDETKPQDPYGIAKVASEQLVKNLCETHGMEYVIAVPHNIIGPRQKYDDPFRNVASIMANMMLQGRQPFIYGDGEQKRCFSFISDVVEPLSLMATGDFSGQIINVGPDEEFVTINRLAEVLAEIINFDLHPNYVAQRPCEVKLATCSSDKARRLLGYSTKTDFRTGLESILDYINKNGTKLFKYHLPLEIMNAKTPKTWLNKLF